MKITPEHVNSCIEHSQSHRFKGTTTTICCITLKNGHTVVGQSACADPEEFNSELGQQLAYNDARDKIYALEAYLLSETMFHDRRVTNAERAFNERSTEEAEQDELEWPEINFGIDVEEIDAEEILLDHEIRDMLALAVKHSNGVEIIFNLDDGNGEYRLIEVTEVGVIAEKYHDDKEA